MGDKIAIVIAVERYRDSRIQKVDYAEADAKGFADALGLHGYKVQETLIDAHATKSSMESHLRRGLQRLRPDDEFILYYAGHGFSKNGHNFLTSHDTDLDDLEATSVSLQGIFDLIDESACERIALFLDSCESGITKISKHRALYSTMSDAELDDFFRDGQYRVCFSACKTSESSYSAGALKHGIWTYHLIEALSGNAPDALAAHNRLTATSLQNYLSKAVPKTLRQVRSTPDVQTPWRYGGESQDFQIADLTAIVEEREQAKPGAEQIKRILFREADSVEIRSLSGFAKKFHHVPDNVSHATQGFVESISKGEIEERMNEVFESIKRNMKYKRSEIDAESGRILTPDFEYATFCEQDEDDPSMAVITEELINVKPSVFEKEGFNEVFDSRFSQIVFEFPHKVDTKSLIDLIEELGRDDIKIDYDKSSSWFTLDFEDQPFSVRVERREFVFKSPEMKTPKELLQGFYDVQKLIEGTPLIPALKA
jgi:uncharacterized caspase-like protein